MVVSTLEKEEEEESGTCITLKHFSSLRGEKMRSVTAPLWALKNALLAAISGTKYEKAVASIRY